MEVIHKVFFLTGAAQSRMEGGQMLQRNVLREGGGYT